MKASYTISIISCYGGAMKQWVIARSALAIASCLTVVLVIATAFAAADLYSTASKNCQPERPHRAIYGGFATRQDVIYRDACATMRFTNISTAVTLALLVLAVHPASAGVVAVGSMATRVKTWSDIPAMILKEGS